VESDGVGVGADMGDAGSISSTSLRTREGVVQR